MLHIYKNSACYWGALKDALKLGANNYLLWNCILWAKRNSLDFFEVGVFDSFPFGSAKEYSVGMYKKQFSSYYFLENETKNTIAFVH